MLFIILWVLVLPAHPSCAEMLPVKVTISPQQIYQGDIALLAVTPATAVSRIYYQYMDQSVDFYYDNATNRFISFLGIDVDFTPGKKILSIVIDTEKGVQSVEHVTVTVLKKDFPIQRLTLPESQVTLSRENQDRYEREQKTLKKIFADSVHKKIWLTDFSKPLQVEADTPFGVRRIMNDKPKNPHTGVDFKSPPGTPVHAASDGVVAHTGNFFFSGNSVFIDHGMGIYTMYFHLDSISVHQGDMVTRNQVIGSVGSTGRATGPHLHWGMRINNQRVDPLSMLRLFETGIFTQKY